ncbi:MAG: nucleotidyltransferase, partial [Bacteriovoracaceae bacterium]
MASDHRAHNESDPVKQRKILLTIVESMETSSIPYAVIGGIAGKELGRPRVTHDIDVFVKPEDAPKALVALKEQAFKTEKRDPAWLYKAWKDDILVDIIFKSAGDIYFDEEIQSHVRRVPYKGHFINAISPE